MVDALLPLCAVVDPDVDPDVVPVCEPVVVFCAAAPALAAQNAAIPIIHVAFISNLL